MKKILFIIIAVLGIAIVLPSCYKKQDWEGEIRAEYKNCSIASAILINGKRYLFIYREGDKHHVADYWGESYPVEYYAETNPKYNEQIRELWIKSRFYRTAKGRAEAVAELQQLTNSEGYCWLIAGEDW